MFTKDSKPVPSSLGDLFVSFTRLALQGFGGVLAFMERELVERKQWLTRDEFVQEWAVARTMPGPPAMNLSIVVGARYFGWQGALAACAGMLCFPTMLILLLGLAYVQFGEHPEVFKALRGMGAVAAGLIIATGLKLLTALKGNPLGSSICLVIVLAGFISIALMRFHTIHVLVGLGALGCMLAYTKMRT